MQAAITGVVVALSAGDLACAADAQIRFDIAPQPYAEALLQVAQQANVTLIGARACPGVSRQAISGRLTLDQVLRQLLAEAPCTWTLIAPGAVQVVPREVVEAPRPPTAVSELMVTATRRVRDPRRLAVAVTAIPRSQLQATDSPDVGDAAGQLAGVLATNLGPGRNKLVLRGLSDGAFTGRARTTVATYLDDFPVNYNAPDPDLRLVDVERVEVARGPQGALYGAGSLAGVYRIVASKPDLDHFSAETRASGASTKGGQASYALEGYANLPLWGVAGARLSAYREIQGGYLDDILQHRNNVDRTERRGARLMLLLQPDATWSVSVMAAGQHLRSDDTHYTTRGMGLDRAVRIPEPHVNDIELVTTTVRRSWGPAELVSATGFVRHAYSSLYDATATQINYTDFARTSAYSERTRTKMYVEDLVLTSRGSGRVEWLAGVYGAAMSLHSPSELLAQNPGLPDVPVYSDSRSDHIRELAAYAEVSYQLTPAWTLAAGGRVFNIRSQTRSRVNSERFPLRDLDRKREFSGFSPKLSVQWALRSDTLLYAVMSEGYRAGGVNSGGALPLSDRREIFEPDHLRNFELGLKLEALERRLSFNSALFYDVWRDIQTDQFRPSGIPYTTNAGDAVILGVESELAMRTDWGLTVQLNGRVSRVRTTNVNPDFAPALVDGLPGAPSFSGGALLSYEHRLPRDWTFRLVGQATYVGRSSVAFDAPEPQMGGYARAKLLAEVSRRGTGVQVYLLNPMNSLSDTFAFGNPFNPDQIRQVTPQRPITIGLTLFTAL